MTQVAIGTPIHCNRCDKSFSAESEMTRGPFCGTKAARLEQFSRCPHCGQNDSHWVFSADIMPTFEGGFDARKRAERKWQREN